MRNTTLKPMYVLFDRNLILDIAQGMQLSDVVRKYVNDIPELLAYLKEEGLTNKTYKLLKALYEAIH